MKAPGLPPSLTRPRPHVAEIRLRRPDQANRIEPGDLDLMHAFLGEIERDPGVHVAILSAEGRIFSAGFHLGALTDENREPKRSADSESAFEQVANRIAGLNRVTIAALNGPVVGGSTDFALACDLRIGVPETSLMMPAGRIGLPLYSSALRRYATRLGVDLAKRMIFTGRRVTSDELERIGFLAEIVAPDALHGRVLVLAEDIAALPPKPLAAMKATLDAAVQPAGDIGAMRQMLADAYDAAEVRRRVAARAKPKS